MTDTGHANKKNANKNFILMQMFLVPIKTQLLRASIILLFKIARSCSVAILGP